MSKGHCSPKPQDVSLLKGQGSKIKDQCYAKRLADLTLTLRAPRGYGTHTKHQGEGGRNGPPVSQERQMLQT